MWTQIAFKYDLRNCAYDWDALVTKQPTSSLKIQMLIDALNEDTNPSILLCAYHMLSFIMHQDIVYHVYD